MLEVEPRIKALLNMEGLEQKRRRGEGLLFVPTADFDVADAIATIANLTGLGSIGVARNRLFANQEGGYSTVLIDEGNSDVRYFVKALEKTQEILGEIDKVRRATNQDRTAAINRTTHEWQRNRQRSGWDYLPEIEGRLDAQEKW